MVDAPTSPVPSTDIWHIEPGHPGPIGTVVEIWRYRRLIPFLATRSLQKIYRRTMLGWVWLIILPLVPILLRSLVFGGLLAVGSDGVPYTLFIAVGSVIWDMFALGLTWGTRALEMSGSVVDQVYLPRAIIPIGNMAPALLDFVLKVAALLFIVVAFWILHGDPHIRLNAVGWTVASLAVTWIFALGLSFFSSPWGEEGRDARLVLGQVLSVWYLLTPVVYPASEMTEGMRRWMVLNPMAPLVETFKWSLFGVGQHDPRMFVGTTCAVFLVLVLGLSYFLRVDAAANESR
jgi:lipopolysaccharide transport system permease protein